MYLIKRGVDPKDAIEITIAKFIGNPKLDIKKLMNKVKKNIKQELYYDDLEI
jgi:hypothetical protein